MTPEPLARPSSRGGAGSSASSRSSRRAHGGVVVAIGRRLLRHPWLTFTTAGVTRSRRALNASSRTRSIARASGSRAAAIPGLRGRPRRARGAMALGPRGRSAHQREADNEDGNSLMKKLS